MVPYSNPQGNNQTTPTAGASLHPAATALPGVSTGSTSGIAASSNPLVPSSTSTASVPTIGNAVTNNELSGIFGSGVGTQISDFENSISGSDSQILQNYVKSLQPQMATAQAQTNAALGAGGVSANSSVAALADANLQSQEFAQISGESANLTDQAMQTEAGLIQSELGPAENYENAQAMVPYEIGSAGIEAAGNIAASICPAEGSLYLLPDGCEIEVETLKVGDEIAGIDDEPQIIEEIQTAVMPILEVRTVNGFVARNSKTHAYALPKGGFVVAVHAFGKTILTADGPSRVISVKSDGEDLVFNIITNGSHTYCADGIWSLGVGEAERQVSMEAWTQIGAKL
jgi:hypothetical protein